MKAVLTTAHGGPEVLELRRDFPAPTPGPGELLVRIAATAVNFHDIFTRRGMPGVKIKLPVIVGSDISGTIEALGQGADAHWLGKRVLIDPVMRDGGHFGMLGETVDGGRAEFIAVQQSMLLEIPAGVSFEQAAALPLAYGTAYRMLFTRGHLKAGERVMVLGASGGVGVACDVANYVDKPFLDTVKEIYGKPRVTGTGGVDVAVNFTGGDTFPATQKCVNVNGRILCCGATAGFDLTLDARYWWTYEHSLIGSNGWHKDDLKTLLDLIAGEPVIDKVLPLEETAEGERLLEDREVVGKVLLKP